MCWNINSNLTHWLLRELVFFISTGGKEMSEKHVVLIGVGCMGEAMLKGLLINTTGFQITGIERSSEQAQQLSILYPQVLFTTLSEEILAKADVLVLCVKPQQFSTLATILQGKIRAECLVISILAGVTLNSLQESLNHESVIRAMPNMPGQIQLGYTGWCQNPTVTSVQSNLAQQVLGALGAARQFDRESLLDTVTAISGSGPGVLAYIIQSFIEAAVKNGLARSDARESVLATVIGTAEYLRQTHEHPAILQDRVASPGGTTAAMLYELDRAGVRAAIITAVGAGTTRSQELSKT